MNNPREKPDPNLRRQLIRELYELYEQEKVSRKKENWKRYVGWLKATRQRHSHQTVKSFERTREFIPTLTPKVFSIRTAHIPTEDLYWCISNVKEKTTAWLFHEIKRIQ